MEDILRSFDTQPTLNPEIWENAGGNDFMNIKLKQEIRTKLLEISSLFLSNIKLNNIEQSIEDIIFTGSLANYNWSKYSDIDLHIILDMNNFDIDNELLSDYFRIQKDSFNTKHNIKIKNFDVEIYAQDANETSFSTGMYSVLTNKWLKTPTKSHLSVDKRSVTKKVKYFINQIKKIELMIKNEEYTHNAINVIKQLKDKIKKYRKSGLASGGEYSEENLVFKYLRRTNYLKKLSDYNLIITDKMLSLHEID